MPQPLRDLYRKYLKLRESKEIAESQKNIDINVLIWAYDRRGRGFTWNQLRDKFQPDTIQENWIRRIFLTTNDNDRKFFEFLRREQLEDMEETYYALNEKGMEVILNYKNLKEAENTSKISLALSILVALIALFGIYLQIKQTNMAELEGRSDRIIQTQLIQKAIEFCRENPDAKESGLSEVATGKSASCEQALAMEQQDNSIWGVIRKILKAP
jgi:hypothetical protein